MATLLQIRTDVLDDLKQTADNSDFSQTQLNRNINRGIEMTALLSETPDDRIEVTVQENVGAYTLPSDNVLIQQAYFGDYNTHNDMVPLEIFTQEVLKNINPYWLDETSAAAGRPERLLLLDKDTVYLDPRPNSTYAGKKLVMFYIYQPGALTGDSETPDLPLAFHGLIHFYATFLCYMQLPNQGQKAQEFYQKWIDHYNLIKGIATRGAEEAMRFKFTFQEE